jgi:2'-5' RNA ligase
VSRAGEKKPGGGPGNTVRLFVALDLPDPVREQIAAWQAAALTDSSLRPMRPQALHVTLCFLSHRSVAAIPRIESLLHSVRPRPVELRFEPEPSPLPKGRPGLYALAAESEQARELQGELAELLSAERLYKPDDRPFWPHVTVARVRSERAAPERGERRGKGRPRRVKKLPTPLPKALLEPFGAVRVALYLSNLKPQGAEYERLAGVDLPSPTGQKR